MFGIIKEITDVLSLSSWNVLWVDDKGKSHCNYFSNKTDARDFYNGLPYINKKMERVGW